MIFFFFLVCFVFHTSLFRLVPLMSKHLPYFLLVKCPFSLLTRAQFSGHATWDKSRQTGDYQAFSLKTLSLGMSVEGCILGQCLRILGTQDPAD